jgi:hypothetical protein
VCLAVWSIDGSIVHHPVHSQLVSTYRLYSMSVNCGFLVGTVYENCISYLSNRFISYWNFRFLFRRRLYQTSFQPTDIYRHLQTVLPFLWSSGHRSWLQIRGSGFDSRHNQFLIVRLGRGPLSLTRLTEEPFERKNTDFGIENPD